MLPVAPDDQDRLGQVIDDSSSSVAAGAISSMARSALSVRG